MKALSRFAVFLSLCSPLAAEVSVKVAGLKIIGKEYQEEGAEKTLRAFNWTAGSEFALLLQSDGKAIVGFDDDESKITLFSDDKGTDFLKAKSKFSRKPYSFGMIEKSESGKAMMTDLKSPGIPATGAMAINIEGELKVSVASKSKLVKSEKVPLKKDAKIVVGEHTVEIQKFGKPSWGDEKLEISFKAAVDFRQFKRVVFYDGEGKEIEAKPGMWSSTGMFGKTTFRASYKLKEKTEDLIMGFEVWTDLEEITVPLKLKVGVGL